MRKVVIALTLIAALSGLAQAESYIGIFDDMTHTNCYGDEVIFQTKTVYLFAFCEVTITEVWAAEFGVGGLPEVGAMGLITPNWNTNLTIGQFPFRMALAFNSPLAGPWAYLGNVNFTALDEAWIGDDHEIWISHANDTQKLVLVDQNYDEIPVMGTRYVFNCTNPDNCNCLEPVPTLDRSWGSIKALY